MCIRDSKNGYPEWRAKHNYKLTERVRASRVVYEQHYQCSIADHISVRHKCDNPSCLNPLHLELGTQKQNMEDMVKRNRSRKGTLTKDEVKEIINLHSSKVSVPEISSRFNVSPSTIYRALRPEYRGL